MGQKLIVKFRQRIVRVALTSGLSRKQVAQDFGIGFSSLRQGTTATISCVCK
jgi:transposase